MVLSLLQEKKDSMVCYYSKAAVIQIVPTVVYTLH